MSREERRAAIEKGMRVTLPDRVVGWFAPQWARKRQVARFQMAATGSYMGASKARRALTEWITSAGDADADILPDLATLRERSRDLIRNNALAAGALNTKVTNVVGTGLRLKASIDRDQLGMSDEQAQAWEMAAEREWRLWSEGQDCDIERTLRFTDIQSLAFRSVLENGDVFILLPMKERPDGYETRVQMVEADRVLNPDFKADSVETAGGVERDESGAPVAYHIASAHPGNWLNRKALAWERVLAFGTKTGRRNVIHLYHKVRIGQTRGVPDLAPVIESLKQLGRYTEAELMNAVVSGMFTVFLKTETGDDALAAMEPTSEVGGSSSDKDYKLGYGAMLSLGTNDSVEFADPKRPNQSFDPFVLAILRQVGVALELPFELLVKHFTASYSAARAALLEAWKFFNARRQWLAAGLCQPVYEAVIEEAVLKGRLAAPGFLADPGIRKAYLGSEWIGPARGQIDELKEVQAARERVDGGFSTEARETAQMTGSDWERDHKQRVRESEARKADGLATERRPNQPPDNPDDGGDNEDPSNGPTPNSD